MASKQGQKRPSRMKRSRLTHFCRETFFFNRNQRREKTYWPGIVFWLAVLLATFIVGALVHANVY